MRIYKIPQNSSKFFKNSKRIFLWVDNYKYNPSYFDLYFTFINLKDIYIYILNEKGIFESMVLHLRSGSRRSVSVNRRDTHALNVLDRLKLKIIFQDIKGLSSLLPHLRRKANTKRAVLRLIVDHFMEALKIIVIEVPEQPIRGRTVKMNFERMENHLTNIGVSCSERFRFQSFDSLRRLLRAFRFPPGDIKLKNRYKSTAEEIVLISLTRLTFPHRWTDIYERFPGRKYWFLSAAFMWFLDFMIDNWSYLLVNNLNWWYPRFEESCNKIRLKLRNLNHENWRQFFEPDEFDVFAFIDDTMHATCRPGGNEDDGPAAPRVPLEVQEAWYNGWKKLHGMKWQTVIIACGMDIHVYGPLSARSNDLTALGKSCIEDLLRALFEARDNIFYLLFGDSAFIPTDVMATNETYPGRGMSSVREPIEWSYKDVKSLWKYCDYKHALKIYKQPVAKIFFVCMLLRNALVALHGCQTSGYFDMLPPTLEEWTEQGPHARPLPPNFIFSPDYDPNLGDEINYDSDGGELDLNDSSDDEDDD